MINEILKQAIPSADLDKVQDYIEHLQAELKAARKQEPVNARLLECISEAVSAYERYGGICTFEGEPMIYASTLIEIAEIAAEAQQASPVRLTDEEFHQAIECHGIPIENVEQAWAIKDLVEREVLRANGFRVDD